MRSSSRALIATVVALALIGAACSKDDSEQPSVAVVTPTPTPTPEPACPLTGEPARPGLDLKRAAVAVKIENSPAARPQDGLEDADVVFEEIVEGGITRFMAIYHCSDDDHAGPVRSARFDDPKIAMPFTKIIAYSGANQIVDGELARQGIVALNEDSGPGLFRDPPGSFQVHNLFANTKLLRKTAPKDSPAPKPGILTFEDLPARTKKARVVTVNFTPRNTIEYRWMGGLWKRFEAGVPFMAQTGEQIAVPNLLVQEVRVDPSTRIKDSAGNASPAIRMEGTGRAHLFRDGRLIRGTWTITNGKLTYSAKSGEPLPFALGPVWIELVPSSEGGVKGSFSFSKKRRPGA